MKKTTTKVWDALYINAKLVTCENGYGLIENGALAVKDGKFAAVVSMKQLQSPANALAKKVYDVAGCCITPGLIDCHTHIVYAGNRTNEFAMRIKGVSYETIARKGGGIIATVNATRQASEHTLLEESLERVVALQRSGVTTLEIKSGYGLDFETELKLLRVASEIENCLPITVVKTFLGAHTIPPEYKGKRKAYIELICKKMLPFIAKNKLASAVDVFCENIAFNLQETEMIFKTAKDFGFNIKCHAEQLTDSGGAELAAAYKAISVDHLEHLSLQGVKALARAKKTVAVLLPGAFYFLREKQQPSIELLRKYAVPIAIASDSNPGTSPILSLRIILNMACVLFRLTPEEALLGVTKYAACALNIDKDYGTLTVGKAADFVVWNISHPDELSYYLGDDPMQQLVKGGRSSTHK